VCDTFWGKYIFDDIINKNTIKIEEISPENECTSALK
jgi:hypothetical protein